MASVGKVASGADAELSGKAIGLVDSGSWAVRPSVVWGGVADGSHASLCCVFSFDFYQNIYFRFS